MTERRAYVAGIGIITSLGDGLTETIASIRNNRKGLGPLTLFPTAENRGGPVGEIHGFAGTSSPPRTHQLACHVADQAMLHSRVPPDAVVLGTTTGGMATTEAHLKKKEKDPTCYTYHSLGSVADMVASRVGCTGPAITVSTACSSGAVAIKIALEMIRSGKARRVLVGGTDSLCRLTYYGFSSLQLIDPQGARPMDKDRHGMSVAEGAAMLLLTADRPDGAVAEILGAGLSCDAYHPAAPEPQGAGALIAMGAAMEDAGITVSDVDYVNLHGTGTLDNDLSEARAFNALFTQNKPLLSSVKGAFGHPLGAAGAIEAVISAISISEQLVPGNTGCQCPDPELHVNPVDGPMESPISTVLSNSFGFGGNNASIVLGAPRESGRSEAMTVKGRLAIVGGACVAGAGRTDAVLDCFSRGISCQGILEDGSISKGLAPGEVRRLKRLPRLALSLALGAHEDSARDDLPSSVFLGTGWGALSETDSFLNSLFESHEQFSSPTDFVGSVHNAPACQIAMRFKAMGANVTATGGDYSFEQAVMLAGLVTSGGTDTILVLGADEGHGELSPLFDPSVSSGQVLSDGGGALCLRHGGEEVAPRIECVFFQKARNNPDCMASLIRKLGGANKITSRYGAIFVGIPGVFREEGEEQLQAFLTQTDFRNPVIDYRKLTGEFATASAVATVVAAKFVEKNTIPGPLYGGQDVALDGKGALVLGLGNSITAMDIGES